MNVIESTVLNKIDSTLSQNDNLFAKIDSVITRVDSTLSMISKSAVAEDGSWNNLIEFAIIMFILSLITERIANFIKLSLHEKALNIPTSDYNQGFAWSTLKFGNLRDKSTDRNITKTRENKVLIINLILGFLVAFMFNADLFTIFEKIKHGNPTEAITGWSNVQGLLPDSCPIVIIIAFVTIATIFFTYLWYSTIPFIIYVQNYLYSKTENSTFSSVTTKLHRVVIVIFLYCFILLGLHAKFECLSCKIILYSHCSGLLLSAFLVILSPKINSLFNGQTNKLEYFLALCFGLLGLVYLNGCIWFPDHSVLVVEKVFGFFLVGCFLSLGSKFWHDMLDLLFQLKNYRNKLNDPLTFMQPTLSATVGYIETPDYNIVKKIYDQRKDEWLARSGVNEVYVEKFFTSYDSEAYRIVIGYTKDLEGELPKLINTTIGDTQPYLVKVEVRSELNSKVEFCNRTFRVHNSDLINSDNKSGAVGFLVSYMGKPCILSCAHLFLTNNNMVKSFGDTDESRFRVKTVNLKIKDNAKSKSQPFKGVKVHYKFNKHFDLSLIPLENLPRTKYAVEIIGGQYYINEVSYNEEIPVTLKSAERGDETFHGKLITTSKVNHSVKIENTKTESYVFHNVQVATSITTDQNKRLIVPGDSGSLVIAENSNKLVGIAFASSSQMSNGSFKNYIIPLDKIVNQLGIDLIKDNKNQ